MATIVLCGYCLFSDYKARPRRRGIVLTLAWGPAVAAVTAALVLPIFAEQQGRLSAERNFYGVLSVYEEGRGTAHRYRSLWHGHTLHGDQYLSEEFRAFPTTYYGPDSGVSVALEWHPKRFAPSSDPEECEAGCLRIGVVGLGAGTVATYGWQGDELYFYEINPAIVRVAEQRFYYLKDTSAAYTVILGDARVSLQRELDERGSRQFDVLVVDAFNDAGIPVHLLTREAFALYWSHLRPDGILAVHVSNLYLDLTPLIRGLAEEAGKEAFYVYNEADEDLGTSDADWVLVTTNQDFLEDEDVQFYSYDWPRDETLIWTDDFVNVVALIQR